MNWFDEDRPKPEKTLTTGNSNYMYVPQLNISPSNQSEYTPSNSE